MGVIGTYSYSRINLQNRAFLTRRFRHFGWTSAFTSRRTKERTDEVFNAPGRIRQMSKN